MATLKDCEKIRPLLSEYVDGTLDESATWTIKMHVSTCAVCAQVASDFTATAGLLRALPPAEPSANFEAMLAKRLASEVLKPRRISPLEQLKNQFVEWWQMPGVRPAFATGAAFALLIPVAFVTVGGPNLAGSPVPVASASPSTGSDTLDELWQEHTVYASSEPLGDRTGLLSVN